MGGILLNIPDLSDKDLIFDDAETRTVLRFFWPALASDIAQMDISNDVRRLAQSALIAAIDGSYALGFIHVLGATVARPGASVTSLISKLARKSASHWWKHARAGDLKDVKIYDVVKKRIALSLGERLRLVLNGVALQRSTLRFYASMQLPIVQKGAA